MSSEATPFSAPSPEELAALFPGYSIHSLIACGGMGAVYFATQTALDRRVAIKILPREFSSDTSFREGFAAEAKAMAKLNHPNLIGVYDFGEVDGMLFIIMEYVPGDSLYAAANGKAIDAKEAARIMSQVCAGIAHAHEFGILHRDIKPANILLDSSARPKIGDFGLARPIGLMSKEGDAIYGTPHYTAPEVVEAPTRVDTRADIFSLGVVLHELLTGKLPADDPRLPSAIIGCSPKFDGIVRKCTQNDPALRYATAAEVASDLSTLLTATAKHRPQAIPRAPRKTPVRYTSKKSGGGGWIVALLLLGGIGAAAFYVIDKNNKTKIPEPEPVVAVIDEPTSTDDAPRPSERTKPRPQAISHPTDNQTPGPAGKSTVFGSTVPTEERPAGPAPIFGVDEFLDRARGIMRQKAASQLVARNRETAAVVDRLSQALKREARSVDREDRDGANEDVDLVLERIEESGNQIPRSVTIRGADKEGVQTAVDKAIEDQQEIDEAFAEAVKHHSATYIKGIEMQIGRLPSNDIGAIRILRDEIESTKNNETYLAELLVR